MKKIFFLAVFSFFLLVTSSVSSRGDFSPQPPTSSYNFYLPYFSSYPGDWTGIALSNSAKDQAAETTVEVYGASGNRLTEINRNLPANGKAAFPVSSDTASYGWMHVSSNQPLSGLAFLGHNSLMTVIPFESELRTSLVIPHIVQDSIWDTFVIVCNPHDEDTTVNVINVDEQGEMVSQISLTLVANGSVSYLLSDLFGRIALTGKIYLQATSGIVAFALCNDFKNDGNCFASIDAATDNTIDPFSNGGDARNMIVIVSDMHLGADLAYAECNCNREPLEKLLKQIKESPNVKELVIAGDLIDEWFVPATIDTYQGKDQADFVQRVATTNKGVFDAFNSIIQEGRILVTYVPGNHDLSITAAHIESVLPGINQARDEVLGLGTYSPVDCPVIAIEHGHRYNFFCAPDPLSNQELAPGTIMPPGYFFTRIAALHVQQGCDTAGDTLAPVTPNAAGDESQYLAYLYGKIWESLMLALPIENKFDEKIIVTNVNGFSGTYAVGDLLPFQLTPDGFIDVNLYNGIQDRWIERQNLNLVPVNIPADEAITKADSSSESDSQADKQYFMNPNSDKRIVVFGHTHDAKIISSENYNGQKTIYANSGTWIDHNPDNTTMNFVVITPQNDDVSSQTYVKLYNFEDEIITKMAESSLRY